MRTPKLLVLDETEELSVQVQRVGGTLRPRPGVVWCDSFDRLGEVAAEGGPFDVLVAGPIASREGGFQRLRDLRAEAPGTQLILALDRWRGTSLRDTVRTGALDILRLPVPDDDLRDALEQAIAIDRPIARRRDDDRRVGEDQGGPEGTVFAVVSATGGCGKTFLATNLAYHLQRQPEKRTCLIDLDLQFGELATALRLRPKHTIHDLLNAEGDDDLARRLEAHLEPHESGIRLLAAPEEPAQADAIDAADVSRIIEAARSCYDHVIVDTPAALGESVLVAVEQADQIFALATLDLPSVRNLGVMLTTLKKLNVPPERIKLLLNKVEPDVGIDVERVEQYFPQGFSMVVPYGREVNRSLNMGQPVLAYAPRGEVSKSLVAGLERALVAAGDDDGGSAAPAPARRRRLFWPARKSA